jgi:Bacterial TSP3 repeat
MRNRRACFPVIGLLLFSEVTAEAALTNTWQAPAGLGKWETSANWNQGSPSLGHGVHRVSPVGGVPADSLIDGTTEGSPSTLTISNLNVQGTTGPFGQPATVALNNASNIGLTIVSNLNINARGSVTITNSRLQVGTVGPADIGGLFNNGFLLLNNGGELVTTNSRFYVGNVGSGQMTVRGGTCFSGNTVIGGGGQGTLTFEGGTTTILGNLLLGTDFGPPFGSGTGTVWLTGGELNTTNFSTIVGNPAGGSRMTVSNGTWMTRDTLVGANFFGLGGNGMLTLAGGASTIFGVLALGNNSNTVGVVQVTGGQLVATNLPVLVGEGVGSAGTLTVAGGGNPVLRTVIIANSTESLGTLAVNGGQLRSSSVNVGFGPNSRGTLTAAGGTTTVTSNVVVGNCLLNAFGLVRVQGGSLYVTNATHDAVLDVRYGWILLNAGLLAVDKLVITNDCGHFFRSGGTLNVGNLILDPNLDADLDGLPNGWEQSYGLDPLSSVGMDGYEGDPDGDGYNNYEEYLAGSDPRNPLSTPLLPNPPPFQVTSILRSGNNIVLTWTTLGGTTNQLQVTNGSGNGSYATNGFANLGPQMLIGGSGGVTTNYTDTGGATNKPPRFYRVRLVP